MPDLVTLDGSYGEGGGQIARTALTLSAITGRPFRLDNIRANREIGGLRPQHLAAVRAMAQLCSAHVQGAELGSRSLLFEPTASPSAGEYVFNIVALTDAQSAGSTTLLLQTVLLPLALVHGDSRVVLAGGTHVAWSPPYHFLADVYLPLLWRLGLEIRLELGRWGWYPRGGGEITACITGGAARDALKPLLLTDRGRLLSVWGLSVASNLPEHIVERQRDRALARLRARHIKARIETPSAPSPGPGTLLFLVAEFERAIAGFTGYGRLRYPAEKVADDACDAFEAHLKGGGALDPHAADQALLPLALAPGASRFTTSAVTRHLLTNAWVIAQFGAGEITIEGDEGQPGSVTVTAG
jgi:RNA 3'-terminal phosphate cyclase (ATP)